MNLREKIRKLAIQWRAIIFLSMFGMIATFLWTNLGRKIFTEATAKLLIGNYSYASWQGGAFFLIAWGVNWGIAEVIYCTMMLCRVFITKDNQKKIDKIIINTINSIHPSYFIAQGSQDARIHISNISKHFCKFFHNFYDHMLQPIIFTLVSLISIFFDDWRLGLLTLSWMGIITLVLGLTIKKQMAYAELASKSRANFKKRRAEVMAQMQLYDLYDARDFAAKILIDSSNHSVKSKFRFNIFNLLRNYVIYFIVMIFCVVGLVALGIWAIPSGNISVKTFIAFAAFQSSLLFRVLGIFRNTASFLSTMAQLRLAVDEIEKIGAMKIGGENIDSIKTIELRNFSITRGKRVLIKNLNLTLKAGEVMGISAPSGSGKSSLINTICGLDEDYTGKIFFNGKDIKSLNRDSINKCITYIPQSTHIINGTIADNISLGKNLSEQAMKDALNKTSLAKMVKEDKNILMYQVGYGGSKLSGGQAQSLCCARAIANNNKNKMIIGDEITANLDKKNAKQTLENMVNEARNNKQTSIFISHNRGDFHCFDKILYQEDESIWKIILPDRLKTSKN